jgi:hypothetical protein
MPRKGFSSFATVYTRASTASGERRFFPLTGLRDAAEVKSVHTATADGLTAGSAYENVTLTKSNMRFGVAARNSQSGTRIELCWVSGRFDTRSC